VTPLSMMDLKLLSPRLPVSTDAAYTSLCVSMSLASPTSPDVPHMLITNTCKHIDMLLVMVSSLHLREHSILPAATAPHS
jgi:hypothetical protein